MKQPSLTVGLCVLSASIFMAGCGGGSGTLSPPEILGRSVSGQALAPTALAGRALANQDVALPGATVTLMDVTNGAPGTAVSATQTDLAGKYQLKSLAADRIYVVLISKQGKDSQGNTTTISMGAVVPPTGSTGKAIANITPSTTVGLGFALAHFDELKSGESSSDAATDIFDAEDDVAQATETARKDGTEAPIDCSKPADDPRSHGDDAEKVVARALRSGVFLADGSARKTAVDMLFDKATNQASATLFVRDNAGDIFDADTFTGPVDATGNFSGKTIDGIYTLTGTVTPKQVQGRWAAVDGSAKGSWRAQRDDGGRAAGYIGEFRGPQNDKKGSWLMFVDNSGSVMIYGHSDKADRIHLMDSIALTGSIKRNANITASLAFPAEGGSLSGTDPTQGTSIVVPNAKVSGFYGSLHGNITGKTTGNVVTGTWKLAGASGLQVLDEAGTWSGTKY